MDCVQLLLLIESPLLITLVSNFTSWTLLLKTRIESVSLCKLVVAYVPIFHNYFVGSCMPLLFRLGV